MNIGTGGDVKVEIYDKIALLTKLFKKVMNHFYFVFFYVRYFTADTTLIHV